VDRELDEEMQFHLDRLIEEAIAEGLSRKRLGARRCARWTGWSRGRRMLGTRGARAG